MDYIISEIAKNNGRLRVIPLNAVNIVSDKG